MSPAPQPQLPGIMDATARTGFDFPTIEVSAVIPCLNEERTIGNCIEKAFRALANAGISGEVVVADNGSQDRSVEIAQLYGARLVHVPIRGYGAALQAGIAAARGSIVIMADADESYDWSAIAPFVHKIREGYDLVMGNRFTGGISQGAMPSLHRYFGNPVLSLIARITFRTRIGDFHCGMRAFTKSAFEKMQPRTTGMEFATEMVANAAYQGLRITELPVVLYPDKRNRPPHLRTFRDGWRHLRFILTYAPDHLYLVPGTLLLGVGIMLMTLLASGPVVLNGFYLGIHFLALGSMMTLVGFNVINLGVLANAVMSQRYSSFASRTMVRFFRRRHALEASLLAGGALVFAGFLVDLHIASTWIARHGAPMEQTVHLAFVATTLLVLGVNLMFTSFLINMILSGAPAAGTSAAGKPQQES